MNIEYQKLQLQNILIILTPNNPSNLTMKKLFYLIPNMAILNSNTLNKTMIILTKAHILEPSVLKEIELKPHYLTKIA